MNGIVTLVFVILHILGNKVFVVQGQGSSTWSLLSAKFMHFVPLPLNTTSAEKQGWNAISTSCDNNFNRGMRYVRNNKDTTRILLYDINGKVAGIQMQFPNTVAVPEGMVGRSILDDGEFYYLSAYFTDPQHICNKTVKRPDGIVGDSLYLQTNLDDYMKVPLLEKDLFDTDWVKGNCFFGMGQHYWYKIDDNMNCDHFFPFFILYNKGKINGFGFAISDYIKSKYLESVPGGMCLSFFQKNVVPKCILKKKSFSIQHVYFKKDPSRIRC